MVSPCAYITWAAAVVVAAAAAVATAVVESIAVAEEEIVEAVVVADIAFVEEVYFGGESYAFACFGLKFNHIGNYVQGVRLVRKDLPANT